MKLEYTYKDRKCDEIFSQIEIDKEIIRSIDVGATVRLATFEIDSENYYAAKKLDKLHNVLRIKLYKYKFFESENGAARYFGQKLYLKLNEFDQLLRRVVYIYAVKCDTKQSPISKLAKNIINQTYTQIYDYLFFDIDFNSKLADISQHKWTKAELQKHIDGIDEQGSIWERFIDVDNQYGYVKEHFIELKGYRNKVMHSRNITTEEYESATDILKNSISELEILCNNIVERKISSETKRSFRETITVMSEMLQQFSKNIQPALLKFGELLTNYAVQNLQDSVVPLQEAMAMKLKSIYIDASAKSTTIEQSEDTTDQGDDEND